MMMGDSTPRVAKLLRSSTPTPIADAAGETPGAHRRISEGLGITFSTHVLGAIDPTHPASRGCSGERRGVRAEGVHYLGQGLITEDECPPAVLERAMVWAARMSWP